MSPIGRIFSVLNLVLAALFLMWASNLLAASQDFKTRLTQEQADRATEKAALDKQISDLRVERDSARGDADLARAERDAANTDAQRQRDVAGQRQTENSNLRADYDQLAGAMQGLTDTNRTLQQSQDEAVTMRSDAQRERDAALRAQADAETRSRQVETENASLKKTIQDRDVAIHALEGQISELDTQLAVLVDATGVAVSDIMAQPLIEGTVVQALYDKDLALVAINKGSNHGVKRGYTFDIFKGTLYKGQVRVENVRPDMCTAVVRRPVAGETIGQGDGAATRL